MDSTCRAKQRTIAILEKVFAGYPSRDFAIRLWDGSVWPGRTERPPTFTAVLNHPGALRRAFLPMTDLSLGEAYIYGDIDFEGDLVDACRLADHLIDLDLGVVDRLALARQLSMLPRRCRPRAGRQTAGVTGVVHSRERDRQAISHHYDISNGFYGLWLDRRMVYTCAYFRDPDDGLDTAQEHKLDHVCRKLRLRPGERMLDIGCGWGGLSIHAAKHYGVEALGITLSQAQVDLAQARIREVGLQGRCRVELVDYRDVSPQVPFDKLVSVGMSEHVGGAKLPLYFEQALGLLRPGGLFLNHAIACPEAGHRINERDSFTKRYVFPDGELVPVGRSLRAAETVGFEVRDVESLREHYALTVRHWIARLETCREEARCHVDEVTYRIWRLYMAGAASGFETGRLTVYQSLLVKPDARGQSGLPLTRDDLYRPSAEDRHGGVRAYA